MRFYRACTDPSFHTSPLFGLRVIGMTGSKLGLYCFVPYKQHPEFCDMQIDMRTCGLASSTLHFYCSMSSKQHSEFHDIQIDRRTLGLAGSRLRLCTMVIPINYLTLSKNIIFNTKVLILNIDIVQFNYIKLLKDVKYLIFKKNPRIRKLAFKKFCTI